MHTRCRRARGVRWFHLLWIACLAACFGACDSDTQVVIVSNPSGPPVRENGGLIVVVDTSSEGTAVHRPVAPEPPVTWIPLTAVPTATSALGDPAALPALGTSARIGTVLLLGWIGVRLGTAGGRRAR